MSELRYVGIKPLTPSFASLEQQMILLSRQQIPGAGATTIAPEPSEETLRCAVLVTTRIYCKCASSDLVWGNLKIVFPVKCTLGVLLRVVVLGTMRKILLRYKWWEI